jgi:GH43 family beta-xylosidase
MKRPGRRSLWLSGIAAGACALAAVSLAATQANAAPRSPAVVARHMPESGGNGAPARVSTFSAPLVDGYAADPSMVYDKQDGYYYLTYNRGDTNDMVMRRARSLAGLATAPDIVIYSGTANFGYTGMGTGGFLKQFGDRWFIYNGTHEKGNSVLESTGDNPLGPYHFKASFPDNPGPHNSGYAFEAVNIDGSYYGLETSSGGGTTSNDIYITTMSNPWTVTGTWHLLTSAGGQPTGTSWECGGGCINEGSSVLVHSGKVFDIFSAGSYQSPDYCVGMAWASLGSDLLDQSSWTKADHCVFQRNDAAGVYGPGSMTFFNAPDGSPWVVYHVKTTTTANYSGNDRILEARPVTWDASGMPVFGKPYAPGTQHRLPGGDPGITAWPASDAILHQARIRSGATAVTGRYVTGLDKPNSSVTFKVPEASAGTYRFEVRYASGASGPLTQDVYVNGQLATSVAYQPTGSSSLFTNDNYATLNLNLSRGGNTVTFRTGGGVGSQASQLSLEELVPVTYAGSQEAIDGTINDARLYTTSSATGFMQVSGIPVKQPYYVGGMNYPDSSVTFSVIVPVTGTYDMQVYYDNGLGASTLTMTVDGKAAGTPSFPSTGGWGSFSPHQYATVPVALRAGENTIKLAKGSLFAELDRIYVPETPVSAIGG